MESHGKDCKPTHQWLSHLHSECKFWHARWELLQIHEGVMCIQWIDHAKIRLRICIPGSLREDVMWHLHDAPTSGHMGIRRTLLRAVDSSYYWPGMKQYVRDYFRSCDICEERKNPGRKKRNYMESYVAGGRFERVAADIAGPFQKTANKNVYILVISDYFTKFSEIYPIPNMEAKTIASVFFRGWIKRYGCPYEFHSDQGTQFESQVFQHLCSMFDIVKTRTTPFHPRSDGLVERMNRTIKNMIASYIDIKQTNWDDYIDSIVMAYNSSVHETTGITPYRMVFGTEMTVPVELQTEPVHLSDAEEMTVSEYVRNMRKNLELVHEIARENTAKSVKRQKKHYNKNVALCSYEAGDIVRRYQPKQIVGTKLKLARNWSGPWIITKKFSDVLFEIKHSPKSKAVVVHANNLKKFHVRNTAKAKLERILKQQDPQTIDVQIPALSPPPTSKDAAEALSPPPTSKDAAKALIATDYSSPKAKNISHGPDQSRDAAATLKRTRLGRLIRRPKRYE